MNECKMKKIWSMLFVFGFMIIMPFSAFATAITPFVHEANIDIIDPNTGNVIRTDNYADILNALVQVVGDVSSFVYGSGVVLTDGDPNDYYKVDFNLMVNPDPWYVWNVTLFNSSTKYLRVHTETFSGLFTEPVGKNSDVSSVIQGGIIDFTGDGVEVHPVGQQHISVTELFSQSNPSVNINCDVGESFTAPATWIPFTNYSYRYEAGPIPGPDPYPDLLWDGFRTTVSFNVTQSDMAVMSGRVDVNPTGVPEPSHTPEPSTLFLIGAGLVMVGLAAWKRKRYS